MTASSKYFIGDKVYWMEYNKVQSSIIIGINFPSIWKGKNGRLESTGCTYRVKANTDLQKNNSGGIPSNWLFATKAELLKSL